MRIPTSIFFTKKLTYDKTNFLHQIHVNKILHIPKKPKESFNKNRSSFPTMITKLRFHTFFWNFIKVFKYKNI
ncbi:hypothetical protein LEP1GSC018_0889 [Leptospira kirschneri str. 2008720114]|nr:hypothetical protein LEP1GSC018_0889 [Leptospira kirschneri str. 2008720114]